MPELVVHDRAVPPRRGQTLPVGGASAPARSAPVGTDGKLAKKKARAEFYRRTVRTLPSPRPVISPVKTAKAAAVAHKLDDECIAQLAALVGATRAWLTPLTIRQLGPRIAIAWMLLYRRGRRVPTAVEVYERAGVLGLHPQNPALPTPPGTRSLAGIWRQMIFTETTTALLGAGWLAPINHPENLALGESARAYLRRQNIHL